MYYYGRYKVPPIPLIILDHNHQYINKDQCQLYLLIVRLTTHIDLVHYYHINFPFSHFPSINIQPLPNFHQPRFSTTAPSIRKINSYECIYTNTKFGFGISNPTQAINLRQTRMSIYIRNNNLDERLLKIEIIT